MLKLGIILFHFFFDLLRLTLGGPQAYQTPLVFPNLSSEKPNIAVDEDTSNLIFISFASLLKQWPNSFFPNGHTIIPGLIPTGTRLYHGNNNGTMSTKDGMEWLAFDPSMSYAMHATRPGTQEILTYSASRPLRVIYLDGQSASVGTPGFQDSQAALIDEFVNDDLPPEESIPSESLRMEYERAQGLCKLGKQWGFEGVIRMDSGFELIWCNFKDGLELITRTNTTDPFSSGDGTQGFFYDGAGWEYARDATTHYVGQGESRIKLDPTSFVSFYDRLPILNRMRFNRGHQFNRQQHRLNGISSDEISVITHRLRAILNRKASQGWQVAQDGIDWFSIAQSLIDHYETRLSELSFVLSRESISARQVCRLTYTILMPYLDLGQGRYVEDHSNLNRCLTAFTAGPSFQNRTLTESEQVLRGAIEGTLARLCRTTIKIFGEAYHIITSADASDQGILPHDVLLRWRSNLNELIIWLGWPTKTNCDPACSPDELCLAPMWPMSRSFDLSKFPMCMRYEEINLRKPGEPNPSF